MNIFDSHAHYTDRAFDDGRDELLNSFKENGIFGVMTCSSDIEDCKKIDKLTKKYTIIYGSAGVHPNSVKTADETTEKCIAGYLRGNSKFRAVGEIGLDYHYDGFDKKAQINLFEMQLNLAKEYGYPVIVHIRDAQKDALEILSQYKPKGVVHCYSGDVKGAGVILNMGMYIGFTGVITYKNAEETRAVASYVPLDRMLIETDCPYLAPVPHRGKRSDSTMLPLVAQVLAAAKNTDTLKILEKTIKNAKTLFTIE